MIQSCKSSVSHAYTLIGKGDDEGARAVSERLSRCAIRGSCPYTRECERTVEMLRSDLANDGNSYQILSPAIGTHSAPPQPAHAGGEGYRSLKGL